MAEELVALDLEEKLKWIQDENEQMEEIGELVGQARSLHRERL